VVAEQQSREADKRSLPMQDPQRWPAGGLVVGGALLRRSIARHLCG